MAIIHSKSPEETLALGTDLGRQVIGGTVITLDGELGVGKTVFAHGIAQGLGVASWRGSPTFSLVHEYSGRLPLFHLDAYRISGAELIDLDVGPLHDAGGVVVVEWAENIAAALPAFGADRILRVRIHDEGESTRSIEIDE